MAPQRRIAICIDDIGQEAAVHAAARALLAQRRVSALSALVDAPAWPDAVALLNDATGIADAGLHLDFSEAWGEKRFRRPFPQLVLQAQLRMLDANALRRDIARQLDVFENAMNRPPDFIDGHRHVHQLPVVRDALVAELKRRYPMPPWLRRTVPRDTLATKPWAVAAVGALGFDRLLRRHALRHNRRLIGVHAFRDDAGHYLQRLLHWLAIAKNGDLLMCHPACGPAHTGDPMARARAAEYQALHGVAFGEALAVAGITVVRLSTL